MVKTIKKIDTATIIVIATVVTIAAMAVAEYGFGIHVMPNFLKAILEGIGKCFEIGFPAIYKWLGGSSKSLVDAIGSGFIDTFPKVYGKLC